MAEQTPVLLGHASMLAANQASGAGGHLVFEVAGRYVLLCGRTRASAVRKESLKSVLEALSCGKCRVLWQQIMVMPTGRG